MNLWDTTDERNVFKKYELLELLNSSEGLKVYKPENCGNTGCYIQSENYECLLYWNAF